MIDFRYNKKMTRRLVLSFNDCIASKTRIDWLLDNEEVCGLVKEYHLFKNIVFFLIKADEDQYRLVTFHKNTLLIYSIDNIEAFLKMSGCNLLTLEKSYEPYTEERLHDCLEDLKELPCTGLIMIDGDYIRVYDYVGDGNNEIA